MPVREKPSSDARNDKKHEDGKQCKGNGEANPELKCQIADSEPHEDCEEDEDDGIDDDRAANRHRNGDVVRL